MKNTNKKRGFTIIELVIVVAVIAILSAVLIPTFTGVIKKANQTADETAVRNINTVIASSDKEFKNVTELVDFLESEGIVASGYAPLAKGNQFVWAAEYQKVLLVNDNKVTFPKEYEGETMKGTWNVLSAANNFVQSESASDLTAAAKKDSVVKLAVDTVLTDTKPAIEVKKDLVVYLDGNDITVPNDVNGDGVFHVVAGGSLTLNGDNSAVVNGASAQNDYDMVIWADGGDVVINGGYYTNVAEGETTTEGDTGANHFDLIYAKNGGKVTINGGSFKCKTTGWTLNNNKVANRPGTIVIAGGEFFEFNPSPDTVMPDGTTLAADGILLADGYTVVAEERADGTWYVVKPAA